MREEPVDKWIIAPIRKFINNSSMSGIVLFTSALLAMIISNSPWADDYHEWWNIKFYIGLGDFVVNKTLHHWINDGLMAVFFFVVGLELKREIVAGELSDPKNAVLPIVAAIGGMSIPALIYVMINPSGEASNGWGVPMATDIAFALGILYLLGRSVPLSLKVFLTALAIVDDLGAVLVIAFFYTSDINFISLASGAIFLAVLISANLMGVRSTLFYGIVGIGGLWLAFLMSGVHATIAAVLAAFTIPANVKISERFFVGRMKILLSDYEKAKPNDKSTITKEQYYILEAIRNNSKKAITPLQRLEYSMHPLVAFVIMPVFAFSNAGVTLTGDIATELQSPVVLGIVAGLIGGKLIGVVGTGLLLIKLKWVSLPRDMTTQHLWGVGFLSAIGFTMSLFIAGLAFTSPSYNTQAKLGILLASVIASIIGFFIIRSAGKKAEMQV
ncbi:MAG TPA: Na+/H+ antiporter NhaA [Saprospiraceae bacterium]|nr:Na+/H+ antiporter NhaA [Saprospiraceae bacterium]